MLSVKKQFQQNDPPSQNGSYDPPTTSMTSTCGGKSSNRVINNSKSDELGEFSSICDVASKEVTNASVNSPKVPQMT
jgi:hypothetical protein